MIEMNEFMWCVKWGSEVGVSEVGREGEVFAVPKKKTSTKPKKEKKTRNENERKKIRKYNPIFTVHDARMIWIELEGSKLAIQNANMDEKQPTHTV